MSLFEDNKIKELKEQFELISKEKASLLDENGNLYFQLYNLENEKRQIFDATSKLEKVRQVLLDKVEKLEIQLHEIKSENKQHSQSIYKLEKEKQVLLDKVEKLNIELHEIESTNKQLSEALSKLEEEKVKKDIKYANLEYENPYNTKTREVFLESTESEEKQKSFLRLQYILALYINKKEKINFFKMMQNLEMEKKMLLDKNQEFEIQLHNIKSENIEFSKIITQLEKEKKVQVEAHNSKSENENIRVAKINEEVLRRAELAEKFETADRFHKFLESFGKAPKLVDLISKLEKNNEDVEEMVSTFHENESGLIEEQSSYLFEYINEKQEIQPKIQVIEEVSKRIDSELEQAVLNELEKSKTEKEKHQQKEREKRFGDVLYTDEDIMNYGNIPGNIANGGNCCDYRDRVYIGFKKGTMTEYNKNTGENVKEYTGYNKEKLTVMKGKLFYGHGFDKYYSNAGGKGLWHSQMIYKENLYFVNKEDGDRIYYSSLEGENPKELCNNALPVDLEYGSTIEYAFSSEWMYYNSIEGFARINLKSSKFELIHNKLDKFNKLRDIICTPKGLYARICGSRNLYYTSHVNPKNFECIIEDIGYFNLYKNKIVFSSEKQNGLFIANPDGSNIKRIAQYYAWDIYIVNDWVYFQDNKAFMDRKLYDYYRVRIDGTGLTWLKEGEPLYVVD
ncbi:DUF5050 domain-containing protein [Clostridium drakei]|uniref:DUF5050 domain-containing protein n=1 Tax=Clostridium drakei TaxID=332101 RepID=A0A2U8DQJ3_9CLOT|nr:DUF5050 domain-containing protein [Clostridium drakei]AWI05023.1 DUF5050 domain-containing protein [Clostridium drakei]